MEEVVTDYAATAEVDLSSVLPPQDSGSQHEPLNNISFDTKEVKSVSQTLSAFTPEFEFRPSAVVQQLVVDEVDTAGHSQPQHVEAIVTLSEPAITPVSQASPSGAASSELKIAEPLSVLPVEEVSQPTGVSVVQTDDNTESQALVSSDAPSQEDPTREF